MTFLRRLFRWTTDPTTLGLLQKVDALESRIHHLEVAARDLLARLGSAEADLAWIIRPDEQPLPAPKDLPEGIIYQQSLKGNGP